MVHVYYHIYVVDGVESIIDEQLNLLKNHFDFPYKLNVGISLGNENKSISNIVDKLKNANVRDIRFKSHEFTTLDLIENDIKSFQDSDSILYFHTKGASHIQESNYINVESWRKIMNYFNIEKAKNVFKIFDKTDYNSYGILLTNSGELNFYSGNFWWIKGSYASTIDMTNVRKNRNNAELKFIQTGKNWKPYSPYNRTDINHYQILFKREEYAK